MTTRLVLCLYDKKAESYHDPFCVPALGVAFRNLADEVNRRGDGNVLFSHAGDFDLVQLGTFDPESGYLEADQPRIICSLGDLRVRDDPLPASVVSSESGKG
ncbi:MAG: nonstructural protein [Microviridae sp.]|nr:MAG: nonstructural protein [Microviridae sp.]